MRRLPTAVSSSASAPTCRRSICSAPAMSGALVLALAPLPFAVTWIDPPAGALSRARPPRTSPAAPATSRSAVLDEAPDGAFVVMTHSHPLDLDLAQRRWARRFRLCRPDRLRTKRARFVSALRQLGIAAEDRRLVCPIGVTAIARQAPGGDRGLDAAAAPDPRARPRARLSQQCPSALARQELRMLDPNPAPDAWPRAAAAVGGAASPSISATSPRTTHRPRSLPARSMRCWARTAPASRRWSRSSTACCSRRRARSAGWASRSISPTRAPPGARHRHGVPALLAVRALTVAGEHRAGLATTSRSMAIAKRARRGLARLRPAARPRREVWQLSVGERQRIEIVRCLLQNPKLLIMDEPTSVLTPQEVDQLFVTLRGSRPRARDPLHQPQAGGDQGALRQRDHPARRQGRRDLRSAARDRGIAGG